MAHYFGSTTFDDTISPRDHIITGLLTLGEGYHNFHHEFPHDYRNGIHWWDYDPTKWFIYINKLMGFARNLNKFPINEIRKGEIDMIEKKLSQEKENINYGVDPLTLPIWTKDELKLEIENAKRNKKVYIIIDNIVHDVTSFLSNNKHPGGKSVVIQRNGKDVSKDFNGDVYNHTNAARNLMSHMRIARIHS